MVEIRTRKTKKGDVKYPVSSGKKVPKKDYDYREPPSTNFSEIKRLAKPMTRDEYKKDSASGFAGADPNSRIYEKDEYIYIIPPRGKPHAIHISGAEYRYSHIEHGWVRIV